ncbi:MAG: chemotaxis response regulator protein-glutamate methylesterase [Nitrospirales bacterium]|nr:MAG: chemotaxis response regulator protein-glutamate methylesterase [Nitrospirales bacterium]
MVTDYIRERTPGTRDIVKCREADTYTGMSKIRVFIVNRAVVMRRIISDEIKRDKELEIVGNVANEKIALSMIKHVKPDVVSMDIEMSVMEGIEVVGKIRNRHPDLPIIMFSTLSQRAARNTLEALSQGANDYITIPMSSQRVTIARQRVREELIPKIKSLCFKIRHSAPSVLSLNQEFITPITIPVAKTMRETRVDVLAIGVSTGGPNALAEVLSRFPKDFPVPIVIVQHMPPIFTKCLSERLSLKCAMSVQEGIAGRSLLPGHVWIAPGNYHMTVVQKGCRVELAINQRPQENSCRPSVDVLFRSVARVFGYRTLGLILTGMGRDGLRGCETIRANGGQILAQDEVSSVVWGMPGAVVHAGLADNVLPLSAMASEIQRRVQMNRSESTVQCNLTTS